MTIVFLFPDKLDLTYLATFKIVGSYESRGDISLIFTRIRWQLAMIILKICSLWIEDIILQVSTAICV